MSSFLEVMPQENPHFVQALDYILNRAKPEELEVFREALERRIGTLDPTISSLNFGNMAKTMTSGMNTRFGIPDNIHAMTRRMVANMIIQQEPHISEEELEALLDQWVPDAGRMAAGKEVDLPPEAVLSMIHQFISYSTGRMQDEERKELESWKTEWTREYWEIFSEETRQLIASFLKGGMEEDTFWLQIRKKYGG